MFLPVERRASAGVQRAASVTSRLAPAARAGLSSPVLMRLISPLVSLALLSLGCGGEAGTATGSDAGTSSTTADTAGTSSGSTSTGGTESSTGAPTTSSATSSGSTGEAGVVVSGDAFAFKIGSPYGRIADATVRVVELPGFTTVTDAMGHFEFAGLPAGGVATFEIEHADFPRARTGSFSLPGVGDLERVTFQVPDLELFGVLAEILEVEMDPAACQIVSTVTRVGKSIYDPGAHGEAMATVTIEPALPAEHGPIYFNDSVIPDRALTETSTDGGVAFVNVPPGIYLLQAHKDGVMFMTTTMKCDAGYLVNASPPYGLQAL